MISLVLLSWCLGLADAVTIAFFPNDLGVCNSTISMTCANFPPGTNQCCVAPPQTLSALFTGLPLPAAQGIIYKGGNCGTSCNAGSGLSLCLTCNPAAYITGANWINPTSKRDAEQENEPCQPIQPDIMTINGRHFNIGVDSGASDEELAEFRRLYTTELPNKLHISPNLLKYENATYVAS